MTLQILQGMRSHRALVWNPVTPIKETIREIRPQILMLNWRRAARWARSADLTERNTDSAADRRGSYLLSSVGKAVESLNSQRSWVQIPPGPLTSSVIFWARIYDLKSVEGCPLVLREGAVVPSPGRCRGPVPPPRHVRRDSGFREGEPGADPARDSRTIGKEDRVRRLPPVAPQEVHGSTEDRGQRLRADAGVGGVRDGAGGPEDALQAG